MESREYMLSVIWRSMDPSKKVLFLDGTEQYFLPRLKLEKLEGNNYELLYTTSDIYRPVEDFLVSFAYENSLQELSDSLTYSYHFDRLEAYENDDKELSDKAAEQLRDKVAYMKTKTKIHLNQIIENYGNKQREDSEAIQEV